MKEKARVFMFVCVGLMALSVAVNQWTPKVTAQVGDQAVVGLDVLHMATESRVTLVTADGDIYGKHIDALAYTNTGWTYFGNPFGTVATESKSLGTLKSQFNK